MSKLVPKLRFKGFSGEWEEKHLKDVTSAIFDGTHQTPKYTDAGVPFFSVENLISRKKNKFISIEDYKEATKKNKPEKGDILITRIGNIGFSTIITWDYDFSIYVTLAVIKKSEKFNSYYLNHYFQSPRYQSEILSKSLLNAVPCKINMDELRKTNILLPEDKQEQQKIANCLSSLDSLIEAQNKKVEALKKHKKGLMQQLFPSEGETVPKLRFDGFCGEWDEIELGKLVTYQNGKAHEQDIHESGMYIVVNSKFISTDGEVKKYTDAPYCIAKKDEVLMVLSDVPNGRAIAKCFLVDTDNLYTVNQRICKLSSNKIVSTLLFYILNRNPYFLDFDDGVKQTNLRKDDVLSCPILFPKDGDEQQNIANCLSSLDNLIEVQNKKVEALKEHKKGLMQQMFVSEDTTI